ncbi:MAG: DNA replication/repair protein RecF [Pseudomonadota bacterium]
MAQALAPAHPEWARPALAAAAVRPAVVRLDLTAFRCFGRLRLDLDPVSAVLTGPNGAGKTNLLEALSFLAPGRGLRRARLSDIDQWGGAAAPWAVAAVVETKDGRTAIGTGREDEADAAGRARRVVRIDGQAVRAHGDLARHLSVVWLTPDMDGLFEDGPSARRRFLDRMVYGFDPEHASRIASYEQAMGERARLLAAGAADPAWLDALEDGMARVGVALAAARRGLAARLDRAAGGGVGPFPRARIGLAGEVETWLEGGPALDAEDRLRRALEASRRADAARGGAACGPHRSDLVVRYAGRPAEAGAGELPAARASTGEQKALLLSILLAFARELAGERGAPPLLLLDEVAAHLDGARRQALFDEIGALGGQAWLTGTEEELFAGLKSRARFFRVLDAGVVPR